MSQCQASSLPQGIRIFPPLCLCSCRVCCRGYPSPSVSPTPTHPASSAQMPLLWVPRKSAQAPLLSPCPPHLCAPRALRHSLELVGTKQDSSWCESVPHIRLQAPSGEEGVALSFLTLNQPTGRLAAEQLGRPLTLLLITPSLCISRSGVSLCCSGRESSMGHPSLPEGLLSVGDSMLGIVPAPPRAPPTAEPLAHLLCHRVPLSRSAQSSSCQKEGHWWGQGGQKGKASQQQAPPPQACEEGKGTL